MKNPLILIALALAVLLAMGLAACSGESQATPTTNEKPVTVKDDTTPMQLPAGHPPIDAAVGTDAAGCSACPAGAPAAVAEKDDCCGTCGGDSADTAAADKTADGCGGSCGDACGTEKKSCGDDCKGDGSCDACQAKKKVDN